MIDTGRMLREAADAVGAAICGNAFKQVVAAMSRQHVGTIITGVGKSFIVGQRAAATMRSFGINAWAESATDMLHGGLGAQSTLTILLSVSGETDEVVQVAEHSTAGTLVAVTSDPGSSLGRAAYFTLAHGEIIEPPVTCGLPVTACYVQAGILDALTLSVAQARQLTPDTVRAWHPGGTLGRKMNG